MHYVYLSCAYLLPPMFLVIVYFVYTGLILKLHDMLGKSSPFGCRGRRFEWRDIARLTLIIERNQDTAEIKLAKMALFVFNSIKLLLIAFVVFVLLCISTMLGVQY